MRAAVLVALAILAAGCAGPANPEPQGRDSESAGADPGIAAETSFHETGSFTASVPLPGACGSLGAPYDVAEWEWELVPSSDAPNATPRSALYSRVISTPAPVPAYSASHELTVVNPDGDLILLARSSHTGVGSGTGSVITAIEDPDGLMFGTYKFRFAACHGTPHDWQVSWTVTFA